ncbi:MAG: SsrA-binding protein SmpB [Christensenellales bacterium]
MEKIIADNKKAYYDYIIEDKFTAGLVLEGAEIKSVRNGKVNLKDSYVIIKNGEVFLLGAHISEYDKMDTLKKIDPTRTRKLLLTKQEIRKLERKVKIKGYTIVPTKMVFINNLAKLEIAVAKGKELYNKKQSIKEKDIKREMDRQLKRR